MKYTIGLFVSVVGFILASKHLNQDIKEYWDFVAFFVVVLGTFAVMFITFPAISAKYLLRRFSQKFFFPSNSAKKHAEICLAYVTERKIQKTMSIEVKLLNDGMELLSLGFTKEKIIELLSQRFEVYTTKINMLSAWFKRNAKYPPAFGLAGTVLGLIHLMRGISSGIDTKETGIRMAIALVATFYGLLISNLVLNPLGEWLQEEIKKDQMKAEMSINSVILMLEQASHVEAQESLNSYLSGSEKLKINFQELMAQEVA
jgi:chemotaxis protein MotA